MILVAFRHGLRVVELCALTWDQIDFSQGMMHVRRVEERHAIGAADRRGRDARAARTQARGRCRPLRVHDRARRADDAGGLSQVARASWRWLRSFRSACTRTCCGTRPATSSRTTDSDTRALQHYLGHKNIMHTVRYTELSPERFKNFWED